MASALRKLARVAKMADGLRVFRGTGGRELLPSQFSKADQQGRKGYVEWGFMSTTTKRDQAVQYSGVVEQRPAPMIQEITVGSLDRGASIVLFSQYQGEEEVLYPPLSFVAPDGEQRVEVDPAHGVYKVVRARVNANLTTRTIEEHVEQKKRSHLASFRYLVIDLRRKLLAVAEQHKAQDRLERDSSRHAGGHTVEGLLNQIVLRTEKVLHRHDKADVEKFTDDTKYKGLVSEMLDTVVMAESTLRLYLEDQSRFVMLVMEMSLQNGHRALVAYRARLMAGLKGEERRKAAVGLCLLQGLAIERIDEASDAGEAPLVRAVSDGVVGQVGIALLIEAGSAVLDGVALGAAATHGHVEAVEALVRAKAPVDSIATNVRACCREAYSDLRARIHGSPRRYKEEGACGGRRGKSLRQALGELPGTRSIPK